MVQQKQTLNGQPEKEAGKSRSRLYTIIIALQISYFALACSGDWDSNIPLFLALFFIAFFIYSAALFALFKGKYDGMNSPWIFLVPALFFRLSFLANEPSLSEDFYRYLWDGRVQLAGHSPYEYAPNSHELEPVRDGYFERINHKQFRTPYSAAAETFYHLFALISTRVWFFKLLILLFDFLLLDILRRLLLSDIKPAAWLLVYAWHPLPVVEFAASGHMDVIGISLLFLSYLLLRKERHFLSGGIFAVSVLTKYLPVLTVPWLLKQGKLKFLLAAVVTAVLLMLQYYSSDWSMFAGVLSYYKKWRFNDSLFGILYKTLGGAEPARITGMLITGLVAAYSFIRRFSFYRATFLAFACVLMFSPVVHPWYMCWILPFLVFHPNKPWMFLCGWIVLAYLARHYFPVGVWKPLLWLKLLIYVPFYSWLVLDVAHSFIKAKAQKAS